MGLEHVKEDLAKRERKLDLDKISQEQADQIAQQIGIKIGNDVKELCERARKLLAIYGLDIKLGYHLFKLGEQPEFLKKEEPAVASVIEIPKVKTKKPATPKKKRVTKKNSEQA